MCVEECGRISPVTTTAGGRRKSSAGSAVQAVQAVQAAIDEKRAGAATQVKSCSVP